jgi:hypothetical protein
VNKRASDADGALLLITASHGLPFQGAFSNCEYAVDDADSGYPPAETALCVIESTVAAGGAYRPKPAVKLRTAGFALYERVDYEVRPNTDANLAELRAGRDFTSRGGSRPLSLKRIADAGSAGWDSEFGMVDITVTNTADFQVTGASLTGAVGDRVTAEVTMRNNGPAWVANLGSGEPVAAVRVQVPPGTTVTGIPEDCVPSGPDSESRGSLSGREFVCPTGYWVLAGAEYSFPFELLIDKVVPGATAAVTVGPPWGDEPLRYDRNRKNNTSSITVN